MITVVETPTFLKDVKRVGLSDEEHREVVNLLAANPKSGTLMQGTGGVRKIRFAGKGSGKSGAYRVVYFFFSDDIPLFALTLFAKKRKSEPNQC